MSVKIPKFLDRGIEHMSDDELLEFEDLVSSDHQMIIKRRQKTLMKRINDEKQKRNIDVEFSRDELHSILKDMER